MPKSLVRIVHDCSGCEECQKTTVRGYRTVFRKVVVRGCTIEGITMIEPDHTHTCTQCRQSFLCAGDDQDNPDLGCSGVDGDGRCPRCAERAYDLWPSDLDSGDE